MEPDQNIAYLVRGEKYRLKDFVLDGLFALGAGFNSHSLYNSYRLVIPGRFVMGEFDHGNPSNLLLKEKKVFIDRTPKTLSFYEQSIAEGKLEIGYKWKFTNQDLQGIVNQLRDYMLSLKRGDISEKTIPLEHSLELIPEPTY